MVGYERGEEIKEKEAMTYMFHFTSCARFVGVLE